MDELTQRAVISREFACWTGTVKLDTTDATHIILRHIPVPGGDGIPLFDDDLHVGYGVKCEV